MSIKIDILSLFTVEDLNKFQGYISLLSEIADRIDYVKFLEGGDDNETI